MKVAFYGPIFRPTGYGMAARTYIHALAGAGIDLSVINLGYERTSPDPLVNGLMNRRLTPDFHIVNYVPAAATPLTLSFDRVIVSTVYETNRPPDAWLEVLKQVRDVWVPCRHNVLTFGEQLLRPVFLWPHAVPPERPSGPPDWSGLPLVKEDEFVFYSTLIWQERKYPEGILAAYLSAFSESDKVVLFLKVRARPGLPEHILEQARSAIPSGARVVILNEMLTDGQIAALTARGDCYLSLHRGEGWCYPLFEAACRGTPVIATAYSGPLDYLNDDDHNLVPCREVHVQMDDAETGYRTDMLWADPDLEHAAALMRRVYEHREDARRRAARPVTALKARFSLEAVGEMARRRLEELRESAPSSPHPRDQ
jgi:glycosyltransferase involved in cell wall biosynthesis